METSVENGVKSNLGTKESHTRSFKPEDFEISLVKEEEFEKYMAFMMEHFVPREPLSKGLQLSKTAFEKHMRKFIKVWISSGASVCATYIPDNELAGAIFTQILTRGNSDIFVTGEESDQDSIDVRNLLLVLRQLEKAVDVFQVPKVSKVVEAGTISVHPKFSGNRLSYRMAEKAEKLAIELGCEVAISQATNVITQHILRKIGFEVMYTLDYASFEIDGKKIFDVSKMGGATKAEVLRKYLLNK